MTTQSHDKEAAELQAPRDDKGQSSKAAREKGLTVVGIGASAGGLSALKQLFKALPNDSGVALVVVVHIPPDRESHLANLLQAACPIPVLQVTETTELHADHVYVIPPNANLSAIDTHLRLTKLEDQRRDRAPIDHFLRTLAQTHDGYSIGVVLSGSGSDGTTGLRWIKELGGVTIAQLPDEAEFDGMPRSAISSGFVDLVLPIDEIPENIIRISRTNPKVSKEATAATAEDEQRDVRTILDLIRKQIGHDFSRYKPSTVRRRIARRMQLNQVETLPDYISLLRQNNEEVLRLFDDLLITVTEFFRDTEVFEYLEQSVVPKLFEGKGFDDQLRVWSVGCSTGEEAYSLAILLLEEAGRQGMDHPRIQVFASDLHERSLKCAREGIYPESLVTSVSPDRLKRWFHKENGSYRVRPEVRQIVVFAPHDLLKDPPFSRQDLVVCRNLMIYLQQGLQKEVLGLFNYALKPNGLLQLGSAESINDNDGFTVVDKSHCLFRKRNLPVSAGRFPLHTPVPGGRHGPPGIHKEPPGRHTPASYGELHAKMAEQYAPPSLMVNHANDIVHYSALAGEFLELRGGEPTKNVFKLVREPLRVELRAALKAAHDQGIGIRTKPVMLNLSGRDREITVRIRLATDPDLEGFALVIFDELHQPPQPAEPATGEADMGGSTNEELEAELHQTHHRLQGIIEEYETSQEQMQASNEELRSALEELETSREELQSMNEELTTVNQENQHRVAELSQLTADLNNLLAATQIATIFLDLDLRIVRYTPQVGDLFNVRSSDRGRPLADLTNKLGDNSISNDARKVLTQLTPIEREIRSEDGNWYLSRVLPNWGSDDRVDGVVITLVDITQLKTVKDALDNTEGRYRMLFESIDQGFCVVEMIYDDKDKPIDYRFVEANPALTEQAGIEHPVGRSMREIAPKHETFWYEKYGRVATTGEPTRFQHRAEELGRDFDVYAFRVGDPEDSLVAILFHDITQRIKAKRELTQAKSRLEDRVRERTAELMEKNKRLSGLSRELASAEHRERKRLAAMLHDDLQQYLVAVKTQLNVAADEVERDMYLTRIKLCLKLVDQALASSRDLTYRIRPPVLDEQGIEPGLKWLAEATAQWYGLEVDIETHGPDPELTEVVQEALFDSVRELLFNVVKHAGVSTATISVETANDRVRVQVNDLGVGLDTDTSEGPTALTEQYGLSSVRERIEAINGTVSITSKPGKGMHVCIEIPLSEDAAGVDTYDDHGE